MNNCEKSTNLLPKDWLAASPDLGGDNWEAFVKSNKIVGMRIQEPQYPGQSYTYDIRDGLVTEICLRNEKGFFVKLGQVCPEMRKARHLLADVVESKPYLTLIECVSDARYKNTRFSGVILAGDPQLGKVVYEQVKSHKSGTPSQPLTRDNELNLAAHLHKIGASAQFRRIIDAQKSNIQHVNVKRLELPFKKSILHGNMPALPLLPPHSNPTQRV